MSFKKNKYVVVKKAVSKEVINFLRDYFILKKRVALTLFDQNHINHFSEDYGTFGEDQVPNTYAHYGDIASEILLAKLKPLMEKETKLKLVETYSYMRAYKNKDVLKKHIDRNSCEISCTLNIGGDLWPIFVNGKKIILKQGDILIYKGCEIEHWREPFLGEICIQVFLHYNEDTANARIYDDRIHLGLPAYTKNK